jgi:uncharacterized protein with PQ loop repeat
MFHRSSSRSAVFLALSFNGLAQSAIFAKEPEWQWFPAAGFAQEYDRDEDAIIASVAVPFRGLAKALAPREKRPLEGLVLLGEDSFDTRVNGLRSSAVKKVSVVADTNITSKTSQDVKATGATVIDASNAVVSQVVGNQGSSVNGSGSGQAAAIVTVAAIDKGASNVTDQSAAQTAGQTAAVVKQPLATQSWFSFLRFTFSFAFVVKALCMMCNIFYQASPLPLITEFHAKGDTGDADLAPFVATAYGGWQWCFYGLFAYIVTQKSGFLVLVYSNFVGATLGLYYVYTFYLHCKNVTMTKRGEKYYMVLGSLVLVQFIAIMTLKPVSALFFSGLVSSVWSTIGSLALISTVPKVYETKNSRSLPVPLLVMGEISAILWIVCGIVLWDPWITFPNFSALLVCTFALHLCWKFPAKDPEAAVLDASEADIIAASMMESTDDCSDVNVNVRTSPLQRALAYVRSASNDEFQPLQDHMATQTHLYGSCATPETGGTGDSF